MSCNLPSTPDYRKQTRDTCSGASISSTEISQMRTLVNKLVAAKVLPQIPSETVNKWTGGDLCPLLSLVFYPSESKTKTHKLFRLSQSKNGFTDQVNGPPWEIVNWHQFIPYIYNSYVLAPYLILHRLLRNLIEQKLIRISEDTCNIEDLSIRDVALLLYEFFHIPSLPKMPPDVMNVYEAADSWDDDTAKNREDDFKSWYRRIFPPKTTIPKESYDRIAILAHGTPYYGDKTSLLEFDAETNPWRKTSETPWPSTGGSPLASGESPPPPKPKPKPIEKPSEKKKRKLTLENTSPPKPKAKEPRREIKDISSTIFPLETIEITSSTPRTTSTRPSTRPQTTSTRPQTTPYPLFPLFNIVPSKKPVLSSPELAEIANQQHVPRPTPPRSTPIPTFTPTPTFTFTPPSIPTPPKPTPPRQTQPSQKPPSPFWPKPPIQDVDVQNVQDVQVKKSTSPPLPKLERPVSQRRVLTKQELAAISQSLATQSLFSVVPFGDPKNKQAFRFVATHIHANPQGGISLKGFFPKVPSASPRYMLNIYCIKDKEYHIQIPAKLIPTGPRDAEIQTGFDSKLWQPLLECFLTPFHTPT